MTSRLAPGYFMTANFKNLGYSTPMVGQSGPLMMDKNLQPVWFNPVATNVLAGNLKQETMNGKPVLTWWQGVVSSSGATTSGEWVVVDQHYRQVATLTATTGGWVLSQHELVINGDDAWVTAYKNIPADLSPYGGLANGTLTDVAVQEYNLGTGQLLYSWDAFNPGGTPNIPLSMSHQQPSTVLVNGQPTPWDAYHINSIQLVGSNQFLVSMRNTWAAYLVNISNGAIAWTLGGSASTFAFGPRAAFQWQHDVELHPNNVVSVFDDACCGLTPSGSFVLPSSPSRALVLKLDPTTHQATFVAQYERAPNFNAAFLGDTQLLPGGNVAVGWGSQQFFSEFSSGGTKLLDVEWPTPDQSYRTYVQPWVGTPYFSPSGAARATGGAITVYASWNGATKLAGWRVLAGSKPSRLTAVATKAKTGFETAFRLSSKYKWFKLQALDSSGRVLGTTTKAFAVPVKPHYGFY
jgi:hypothetical protein